MGLLDTLLAAFGGTATALVAIGFLFKSVILDRFQRTMANYKTELSKSLEDYKHELATRSEALRSALNLEAHRRSLGLTRYDTKRSEALKKIWRQFLSWDDAYSELIAHVQRIENDPKSAINSADQLQLSTEKVKELFERSENLKAEVRLCAIHFEDADYRRFSEHSSRISKLCSDFHRHLYGEFASSNKVAAEPFISGLLKAARELRETLTANDDELRRTYLRELRMTNRSLTEDLRSAQ